MKKYYFFVKFTDGSWVRADRIFEMSDEECATFNGRRVSQVELRLDDPEKAATVETFKLEPPVCNGCYAGFHGSCEDCGLFHYLDGKEVK